mgnify:CR=1 FL=1
MQVYFNITGMSCSACSSRIEKIVSRLECVKKVEVNLLTNSMSVEINNKKDIDIIIKTVQNLGYGASVKKSNIKEENTEKKGILMLSFILLVILMYISMGKMFSVPMPEILLQEKVNAILQLIITIPILILHRKYFINGFKNLFHLTPNMDSLIAIGGGASFLYGIFAIYKILQGDLHYSHQLYFESSAMIVTLISCGKYLEARAKSKTTSAINKLINLSPEKTTVIRSGKEEEILTTQVKKGDIVIIKPGEKVPVDGVVIEGSSYIDQSAITGESVPVKKQKGDEVFTASVNQNGSIKIEAQKVGEDTTLAQIITLVENASSSKAPIGKLADKVSGIFVPVVITIAILATIIWLLVGKDFEFALSIGIAVLVISCPCALGLATPVSIMVGTGKGAENGILIKSAESLENAHKINKIIFDKTGTITEGKAKINNIFVNENKLSEQEFIKIIASVEKKSEHIIAKNILQCYNGELLETTDFEAIPGKGVMAKIENDTYLVGNEKLMKEKDISIPEITQNTTILYVSQNQKFLGYITIKDTPKKDAKQAITNLNKMNIETIMLTGDNESVAQEIAQEVGIKKVIANVLPQHKEKVIRDYQEEGNNVAMVGDGINDSPALARANVGIAIGAGTDIAIETADIVLIKNSLLDVVKAIHLSKATIKNIKMSLFWAFIYNIIGIPIAAGILYPAFGFTLNPMIAAACMSFSSVSVVLNALMLRKIKL